MSNPPIEAGAAKVRESILEYFGDEPGARYVRSTETWFGMCPDCLMWVRDGHASMEAAVGVWIGRWAESSGAATGEVNAALEEYTSALRGVFGVDAVHDLDGPHDTAPDHKGRCRPLVFRVVHGNPNLKLATDRGHPVQE